MAADDVQGVHQGRVLDTGVPVGRKVIDVEEPLSRGLFRGAAAGRLRAFEIDGVYHDQPAVQAFQGKSDRVEGGEGGQQGAPLRQRFGRLARQRRLVEQGKPARPRQRNDGFVRAARLGRFRRVDDPHEQACAVRRFGYPDHAALNGQRTGGQGLRHPGFGQRGRTGKGDGETRQRFRNGVQPGIGLSRQFRWRHPGQQGSGQTLQQGAWQAFGDDAERGVFFIVASVRRDPRQQPARFPGSADAAAPPAPPRPGIRPGTD